MEPIARFLDTLSIADDVGVATPDPVAAAIELATSRLLSFVDDIDAMLDDAHSHAEAVVNSAYAEAARIISDARLHAQVAAPDVTAARHHRAA